MVGLVIYHEGTGQKDKPIGFSFRRRDQLSTEVIWRLFEVAQSNSRFNALDPLSINLHYVKTPAGFGKVALKTKGRLLEQMAHLKSSIVPVNAETNCLAHALIIAIARVDNDPNYNSYRRGYKIHAEVDRLLEATGVDLSRGGEVPELESFQQYFHDRYKIVVYTGLRSDSIIYEGQVDAPKTFNLLLDEEKHHVINNLSGAFAKGYVCEACNKSCRTDVTHICDQICSDCHQSPPCIVSDTRVPCKDCNRHFRSQKCFENHKQQKKKKSICERVRLCDTCHELIIKDRSVRKHECFKRFCPSCMCNRDGASVLHGAPIARSAFK
jgi:hypothetical protein